MKISVEPLETEHGKLPRLILRDDHNTLAISQIMDPASAITLMLAIGQTLELCGVDLRTGKKRDELYLPPSGIVS